MLQLVSSSQWRFRLGLAQRIANPVGKPLFIFVITLFFAYGVSSCAGVQWRLYITAGIIACVFCAYIMFYKIKQAQSVLRDTASTVVVYRDRFSIDARVGIVESIPYIHITKIARGLFGCSVIGLISGHTLVLPKPIADQIERLKKAGQP